MPTIYHLYNKEMRVLREWHDIGCVACEILLLGESPRKLHSFQEPRRVAISGVLNLTVEIVSTSPVASQTVRKH